MGFYNKKKITKKNIKQIIHVTARYFLSFVKINFIDRNFNLKDLNIKHNPVMKGLIIHRIS